MEVLCREQYLYLTTRGRATGLPREIEIWFTCHEEKFYIIAEYPNSNWVRNLQAHPEVQVRVEKWNFSAQACVLTPEIEPELTAEIRELSRKKYAWGDGLVVELSPLPK